jgi:histidinol-phosphate/aromatic aminotransferase/cobyric acid decarboxylase-like protein/GNAT superfamily N-acetyltransferase
MPSASLPRRLSPAHEAKTIGLHTPITIAEARKADRPEIYALRHRVYALELGQHAANSAQQLSDPLDVYNVYLKACVDGRIAGFVSITPPGRRYSVDKYFQREVFPFPFDDRLYEVRLLTVLPVYRRSTIAALLMYAALRLLESRGGSRVVAIGRREIISLYRKAGLQLLGHSTQSGAVTYDLLSGTVAELRKIANRHMGTLRRLARRANWQLSVPFLPSQSCHHGGACFEVIGEGFDHLERSQDIISADVLDAWFPPSPRVISALQEHLSWLLRTSPPVSCAGMIRAVAGARAVPAECIVPAAGSSELIFLALREWLNRDSRVLLLDPCYGEYSHLTERLIGCRVDRFPLQRKNAYQVDSGALETWITAGGYHLIIIVNPNSPTGRHVPRHIMEAVLSRVPANTRVWVDETYVDYAGADQSLEAFAAKSQNVAVCKSMSKVYALSGARAAYLCGPPELAARQREITPPWAVSLPAQVAAVNVLADPEYYQARYRETHRLRETLACSLERLGLEVIPSVANFLLCHLPESSVDAATVCERCRGRGLYIRNAGEISPLLGSRALRIAVKDDATNRRIAEILGWALSGQGRPGPPGRKR